MENQAYQSDSDIEKSKTIYLETEAYPLFQKLIADLLPNRPKDLVNYLCNIILGFYVD